MFQIGPWMVRKRAECAPRCIAIGRFLLKGLFPIFLVFLAMLVGWFLYPIEDLRWATLIQMHVAWDLYTGTVEQSMVVEKHSECQETSIKEYMQQRMLDGTILPAVIVLDGNLSAKIQALPAGDTRILFDRAMPVAKKVIPGDYILTITALCHKPPARAIEPDNWQLAPPLDDPISVPPSPTVLETEPVQALFTIPRIDVMPIPSKGTRR